MPDTIYKTEDGKEFEYRSDAQKHANDIQSKAENSGYNNHSAYSQASSASYLNKLTAESMRNVSEPYAEGRKYCEAKDYNRAIEWLTKAINIFNDLPEGEATYKTKEYYSNNRMPVEKIYAYRAIAYREIGNIENAVRDYKKAITGKWSFNLTDDFIKSAEEYIAKAEAQQAAEQEKANAEKLSRRIKDAENATGEIQSALAYDYLEGINGVPQDNAEAAKWWRKAIDQGYDSYVCLGECYELGLGVEQDYDEAARLYKRGAEKGCALCQYKLGFCYKTGKGVPLDFEEAVHWYSLAVKQKDFMDIAKEAKGALKELQKEGKIKKKGLFGLFG